MKRLIGDGFSPAIKFCWIRNENAEGFLSWPLLKLIQLVNGLVVSCQSGQTIEGFRRKSYHPTVDNELGGLPYGFLALGGILLHFEYEWHTNDYTAKIRRTKQRVNPKSEYRNWGSARSVGAPQDQFRISNFVLAILLCCLIPGLS